MNLKKWVEDNTKNYELGLAILEANGGSSTLLNLLKKGETRFNRDKLSQVLTQIYQNSLATSEPVNKRSALPKTVSALPKTVSEPLKQTELPAEVKAIHDLRLSSFKKMSALHQHLCSIHGNGELAKESRLKILKEIIQLDEVNTHCWDKIYYYERNGHLPVDESGFLPEQLSIRELVQLEKAIPTYITKLSKEAQNEKLSDEARQKLYNRKTEWHIKQNRVKQELDALPTLEQIKKALC